MQSFAKGLCLRACLTWLVLTVLVVSCTSPPSPTPSLSGVPQGQPVFLEKSSASLSLLEAPQALQTLSRQSKPVTLHSQPVAQPVNSKISSADFKIQLFVNADGVLAAPQISGSELYFDAYFGVYAWSFTAYFPEGVQSSWTTQLTRAASNPCGTSFFPSSSSLTPPDDGNPDTRAHAVTWLQAPDLNTIKNGAYIFTMTDNGGHSYTFVTGGQPNACPTASPTPVPTPTPTPSTCPPGQTTCPSPEPTPDPCSINGFSILANKECLRKGAYEIPTTDCYLRSDAGGGHNKLISAFDIDPRNTDITLGWEPGGYSGLTDPGKTTIIANVNGKEIKVDVLDTNNWPQKSVLENKILWTEKMNESIANDQETGQIPSSIIEAAKAKAIQNGITLDTSVLDYLKRKNKAPKIVMAIDASKMTDAFGKNNDGSIKNGSALVTFSTLHNYNGTSELYTMKLQMTFKNGQWGKIECKN